MQTIKANTTKHCGSTQSAKRKSDSSNSDIVQDDGECSSVCFNDPAVTKKIKLSSGKKCHAAEGEVLPSILDRETERNVKDPTVNWQRLHGPNLNCEYTMLYQKSEADRLLAECEKTVEYNTGLLSRVRIMGKWHEIPRKQVAQGTEGLTYKFSGNTVAARPWIPVVKQIRDRVAELTGWDFNFVLINRYQDGNDHIGEHRDDEKDLVAGAPIASVSFGQSRDFLFKHRDARGRNATKKVGVKTVELKSGMLLMMNHPTNTYWYHSLPKRQGCPGVRISLTFRMFKPQEL